MNLKLPTIGNIAENIALLLIGVGYLIFPMTLGLGMNFIMVGLAIALLQNHSKSSLLFAASDPLIRVIFFSFFLAILSIPHSAGSWKSGIDWTLTRYWKYLLAILLIVAMRKEKMRTIAVYAFFVGVSFIVLSMYLNIWISLPWSATKNTGFQQDHTVIGDYITQNLMVILHLLLGLHFFFQTSRTQTKLIYAGFFVADIFAIFFLSPGRTGYLLSLVGISIFLLFKIKTKIKWLTPIMVVALGVFFYQSNPTIQQRVNLGIHEARQAITQINNNSSPDITSIGARIYMWDQTWELIMQRPLFGWGLGAYKTKWCEQIKYKEWCNEIVNIHPHNQYLMAWVELGLGGLALLLLFIWTPLRLARGAEKYGPLMAGLMAYFAVDCLFNSPLWVKREYQFFLLMIPVIYACMMSEKEKTTPPPPAQVTH